MTEPSNLDRKGFACVALFSLAFEVVQESHVSRHVKLTGEECVDCWDERLTVSTDGHSLVEFARELGSDGVFFRETRMPTWSVPITCPGMAAW